MALGAAIYKASVNLSNLVTHDYEDYQLTLAKHPSETELRMMYRLITFLLCAHHDLEFSKGLSSTDEPELWRKDYSGDIIEWIELGLPDLKRIKQACGKSQAVKVYTYQQERAVKWFGKIQDKISHIEKLDVYHLQVEEKDLLEKLVTRNMVLNCLIQDENLYLSDDQHRLSVIVKKVK